MRTRCINIQGELGGTLLEFTFVASTFFMMLLAITSGANLYFTHNALVEATRRGARFAATQAASSTPGTLTTGTNVGPSVTKIRNYAIYGNAAGTGPKLMSTLEPANISIQYVSFGVGTGAVSVSVTGYNYNLVIPGISRQITMPPYRTTVTGESAGTVSVTCP
ncbi:MAG: pilus assembly protein [Pyrinomonadaceae bacterium]|nr:pilus assembly protein [Pyrinomonadaceae bacterium]